MIEVYKMVRSMSAFLFVIPAQAGIQVFCSLPV